MTIIATAPVSGITRLADENTHGIPGKAHPRWCVADHDMGAGVHFHTGPSYSLDVEVDGEEHHIEWRVERMDRPGEIGRALATLTVDYSGCVELTPADLQQLLRYGAIVAGQIGATS